MGSTQTESGAFSRWLSGRRLRAARKVGADPYVKGGLDFGGGGAITIGDRFLFLSQPARSHMIAFGSAAISIGDDVRISYGAAIFAMQKIEIGNATTIGPYVVIMDGDFHRAGDRNASGEIERIRIGSNVNIGARVTILRGSVIGDGVTVMSGSMVSGTVADGSTVGGVPARVITAGNGRTSNAESLASLIQEVLGLPEPPRPEQGPGEIQAWDSLGTLRLLLAIEEAFGVSLDEAEIRAASNVASLSAIVESKLGAAPSAGHLDVAGLVQEVLGLAEPPLANQGPADIAAWDSLGTLRLLLAIEEAFGVTLEEGDMKGADTVAKLSAVIAAKLTAHTSPPAATDPD